MRNDNELVNQLVKMPDVHIMMHAGVLPAGSMAIFITMDDNHSNKVLRMAYTVDEIDIYGFELLLKHMYRELKGSDYVE